MSRFHLVLACSMCRGGTIMFHFCSTLFLSVPHKIAAKHGTVLPVFVCSVMSSIPNIPQLNNISHSLTKKKGWSMKSTMKFMYLLLLFEKVQFV